MDTSDRLPQTGDKGIYLKQQLKDKLIEYKYSTSTNAARTYWTSGIGSGARPTQA
jgi:hypothetical protein